MEPRNSSKLKILYIIDILRKFSDEEHPINATEICDRLAALGVKAERKAIYDDIDNLIFYGFDIIKTHSYRRQQMHMLLGSSSRRLLVRKLYTSLVVHKPVPG